MSESTFLTSSEESALAECSSWMPGYYKWKPATMRRLSEKGLVFQMDCGAYALTKSGGEMVKQIESRKVGSTASPTSYSAGGKS